MKTERFRGTIIKRAAIPAGACGQNKVSSSVSKGCSQAFKGLQQLWLIQKPYTEDSLCFSLNRSKK